MKIRIIISVVIITALSSLTVFAQNKKSSVKDTRTYVDLGLPSGTLWATCNIGASKPEEYGLYFAWGDTKGYTSDTSDGHLFNYKTYKFCRGTYNTLTKYGKDIFYGVIDNKDELESEDDAATINWGSKWEMPSLRQIEELCDSAYTTTEWTTLNGINGRKITSRKNGKSIFLPATGWRYDDRLWDDASYGGYWSRSLSHDVLSHCLHFDQERIWCFYNDRERGVTVRPVRSQNPKSRIVKKNKRKAEMEGPVEVFLKVK